MGAFFMKDILIVIDMQKDFTTGALSVMQSCQIEVL
jgi:nicotinamidase-related amidase